MTRTLDTFASELVAHARGYEGVSYRHHGRSRLGLDCLGLYLVCLWEMGVSVPDFRDYSQDVATYTLRERVGERMTELGDWREARAGDVLLARFHVRLPASHLMVVTDAGASAPTRVIHASNRTKRVVEQRLAHVERIVCAFRWPGGGAS